MKYCYSSRDEELRARRGLTDDWVIGLKLFLRFYEKDVADVGNSSEAKR